MIESDDKKKIMMLETPCLEDVMNNDEEESMESTTPRTNIGSNDANNTS